MQGPQFEVPEMSMPSFEDGLFMVTNRGLFDLNGTTPDYLTALQRGGFLGDQHDFVHKHNRRAVISDHHRLSYYSRGGVAGTIVDDPAEHTWAKGFSLETPDEDLRQRIRRIWIITRRAITTADIWGRIFGSGLVVYGFNDKRALRLPAQGATDIQWAQAFSRTHIKEIVYDKRTGPNFGKPLLYLLRISKPGDSDTDTEGGIWVHHTRVQLLNEKSHIHPINGKSALDRPFNDIEDALSLAWGNAAAYAGNAEPKWVLKTVRPLRPKDELKIDTQMAEARHKARDVIKMLSSMTLEPLTNAGNLPKPLEHAIVSFSFLASSSGIPFTRFFRHHLVSGEAIDWANREWYDYISDRQSIFGVEVVRDWLTLMAGAGVVPDEARFLPIRWSPPRTQTREDIGRTARNEATAVATSVSKTGLIPKDLQEHFVEADQALITRVMDLAHGDKDEDEGENGTQTETPTERV